MRIAGVRVRLRCAEVPVPERRLHDAQVPRALPQPRREGMPQRVHGEWSVDAGGGEHGFEPVLSLARREAATLATEDRPPLVGRVPTVAVA